MRVITGVFSLLSILHSAHSTDRPVGKDAFIDEKFDRISLKSYVEKEHFLEQLGSNKADVIMDYNPNSYGIYEERGLVESELKSCGDGTCEFGETLSNCELDCAGLEVQTSPCHVCHKKNHIKFNIEAVRDIIIKSLAPILLTSEIGSNADYKVKVSTKQGSYDDDTDWEVLYDNTSPASALDENMTLQLNFSKAVNVNAGKYQAFQIALESDDDRLPGTQLTSGDLYESNSDIKIYSGTLGLDEGAYNGNAMYDVNLCVSNVDCNSSENCTNAVCNQDGSCEFTEKAYCCGNGKCEEGESSVSCPSDCEGLEFESDVCEFPCEKDFIQGIAFDVQAKSSIKITGMDIEVSDPPNTLNVKVFKYTDSSSIEQVTPTKDKWEQIHDEDVTNFAPSSTVLTLNDFETAVVVDVGETQAFLVLLDDKNKDTLVCVSEEFATSIEKNHFTVSKGKEMDSIFNGLQWRILSTRGWMGTIKYSLTTYYHH